jgi:hypothetical protein
MGRCSPSAARGRQRRSAIEKNGRSKGQRVDTKESGSWGDSFDGLRSQLPTLRVF